MKELLAILGIDARIKAKLVGKIKGEDAYIVITKKKMHGLGVPIRHFELEGGVFHGRQHPNQVVISGEMFRSEKWKITS